MYASECKACGWESQPIDTEEAAAGAGLMHLATAHAHALAGGDVSSIRVWTFGTLQATIAKLTAQPEPGQEPEPETPPAKGGHAERPSHDRPKEPVKGRK